MIIVVPLVLLYHIVTIISPGIVSKRQGAFHLNTGVNLRQRACEGM